MKLKFYTNGLRKSVVRGFILFVAIAFSASSFAQGTFTSTWTMSSSTTNTAAVSGASTTVTGGLMTLGSGVLFSKYDSKGVNFTVNPAANPWPTVSTSTYYIDFPITANAGYNINIATSDQFSFIAELSNSSGDIVVSPQYSINGSPYVSFGTAPAISGTGTINITPSAPLVVPAGQTINIRIFLYAAAANNKRVVKIKSFIANGTTVTANPPVATLSSPTQTAAANIQQGTSEAILYNFQIAVTSNVSSTAKLSGLSFSFTNGFASTTDFTGINLYYSNTNVFPGIVGLIGTISNPPNSPTTQAFSSFIATDIPGQNTGYFWIAADVDVSAVINNYITVNSVTPTFSTSTTLTNTATAAGKQTIVISTNPTTKITGNPVGAATIGKGSTDDIIQAFYLTITVADAEFTGLTFPTATGTYNTGSPGSDITNFKLYYSSANTFPGGTPLATITSPANATSQTFPAFSQIITAGTNGYFWITCDVSGSATTGRTVRVTGTMTNTAAFLSFAGTVNRNVATSAAQSGLQTIGGSVYYNKANTDLSVNTNWTTVRGGGGATAPAGVFATSGVTFNLYDGTANFLGAALTINTGSQITLGDYVTTVQFTVPSTFAYTGNIDVADKATLTLQNATIPTLGTISGATVLGNPGSTIEFSAPSGNQTVPAKNFYNLTLAGAGNRFFSAGTIGIAGVFTPGTFSYASDFSEFSFNGTIAQTVPAFNYYRLFINNTSGTTTTTPGVAATNLYIRDSLSVNENFTLKSPDYLTLQYLGSDSAGWYIEPGRVLTIAQGSTLDQQTARGPRTASNAVILASNFVVNGEHWMNSSHMTTKYGGTGGNGSQDSNDGMIGTYTSTSWIRVFQGVPRIPQSVDGNVTWTSPGISGEETFLSRVSGSHTIGGTLYVEEGKINVGSGGTARTLTINGNLEVSAGEYHSYGGGGNSQKTIVKGDTWITGGKLFAGDSTYTSGFAYNASGTEKATVEFRGNVYHTAGEWGEGYWPPATTNSQFRNGIFVFSKTSGQQLVKTTTAGLSNFVRVELNNPYGILLQAPASGTALFNPDSLYLINGTITSPTNTLVYPDSMYNASPDRYVITLGTGALKHKNVANNNGIGYIFHVATADAVYTPVLLQNTGTVDNFTVSVNPTSPYVSPTFLPFLADTGLVQVQYKIQEETQGGSNVAMKLQWNTIGTNVNESPTFNRASPLPLKIARNDASTAGTWLLTDANLTATPVSVTGAFAGTGVSTYSDFQPSYYMVGHECAFMLCQVLPVGTISFTGKENTGIVNLQWKSTEETNLKNFEVERSIDSRNFSGIGTVTAKGSGSNSYDLDDTNAPGGVLYYRLRIIDKNGKYTYSQVVTINMKKQRILQLYPNPVTDRLTISHAKADKNGVISIYGFNGVRIASIALASGSETTTINTASYAAGVYMLKYENNGTVQTERFVKR